MMGMQNPTKRSTRCMHTAQEQRDASIISAVASGMPRQNPACWNVSIYAHHKHNVKAGFLAGEWGNCLVEAGSRYWTILPSFGTGLTDPICADERPLFKSTPKAIPVKQGKSFAQKIFWFLQFLLLRCENLDSRSLLPSFLMILTIDLPIFRRVLFLAFLRWSTSCQDAATVASPKLLTSSRGRNLQKRLVAES